MLGSGKRRTFIAILTIVTLLASSMITFAAGSSVSIKNYKAPSSITQGKGFKVKGSISSNSKIKRVEIGIVDSRGKWTRYKYDKSGVNAKTFNVKKAASKLKFSKLSKGSYRYRIYAHTSDGVCHTVLNKKFKVKAKAVKKGGLTISSLRTPSTLVAGKGFTIKGKIKSGKKIKSVTVGVTKANGKWTSVKYTKKKINATSYNIHKIDSKVKFGKLSVGDYRYRVDVKTSSGTKTIVNTSFKVTAPATKSGIPTEGGSLSGYDTTTDSSATLSQTSSENVELVNAQLPGNYSVGKGFTISGQIRAKEVIKRVEVGIVFAPTNKWTTYKYDNSSVNSMTFDLSQAASKLKFDKLPGGTFKYRIYVHTASGVVVLLNHQFIVSPGSKPMEAVNWAIQIASDNTFSYGKKPATSKLGCYFCGTNQKRKPKGYEKTYVCLTYIGAAYAHGAKDPDILKACKNCNMPMYENDYNFKKFSCWMKLGSCKELTVKDLQPGDVVIKWSDNNDGNGHVWMYVGGDQMVESISGASGGCWGANSIALKSGAASRLKSYGSSSKNYVMRYIH